MKRPACLLLLATLATPGFAHEPSRAVQPRDFFLYSCVSEFTKAHSFPLFDNSVGYAVEYSTMSPEVMSAVHAAARKFALSLRAPDLKDEDHGGVAVMALCLEESRSGRVEKLVAAPAPK